MRIVIQRVSHASVTIEGDVKSAIQQGYLILLGIEESDTSEDIDWNRPSWLRAAKHEISVPLYEEFCKKLSEALGKPVGTGEFGADMKVELLNDGPVTIMMDTHNKE